MKGEITKALEDAITLRKALIADGTPEAEADYIAGQGLKAVMGNTRHERWRFYCDECRDTGWRTVETTDPRVEQFYGSGGSAHGHVVKCEPCRWNQMEREKRKRLQGFDGADDDDLAAAAQVKKPARKFSRFGQ